MTTEPMTLAQLLDRANATADALEALATEAARVPYAAQATVALVDAATSVTVAASYIEAITRHDTQAAADKGLTEACDVCGAALSFPGQDGERTTCAACRDLVACGMTNLVPRRELLLGWLDMKP